VSRVDLGGDDDNDERRCMESAGQEVGRIETRLRQLGTRLDKLLAKAEAPGTAVKAEYRNQIAHTREKHAVVQSKLNAYRAANGEKWDNFRGAVELAWYDLDAAFKAIQP
jgi:hypothetical protein